MVLAQVAALLVLAGLGPALGPALAADEVARPGCYSKLEQRSLLSRGEIVSLSDAIRAARPQQIGDVLRAQLCQSPKGAPAYVLTLLPHSGKVTRVMIDAKSGAMLDASTGTVMSGSSR